MSRALVVGRRPCMWCDDIVSSRCVCGAAICIDHMMQYGQICPLCVRLGRSRSAVIFPLDWEEIDRSTIPLIRQAREESPS